MQWRSTTHTAERLECKMGDEGFAGGEEHRCVRIVSQGNLSCCEFPLSVFHHVGENYAYDDGRGKSVERVDAIHRCFSLARLYGAKMYVRETIPIVGHMLHDTLDFIYAGSYNVEVKRRNQEAYVKCVGDKTYAVFDDSRHLVLNAQRISFWRDDSVLKHRADERLRALDGLPDSAFIGYMILVKAGRVFDADRGGGLAEFKSLRWIVYESILDGGESLRGVIPRRCEYDVRIGNRIRRVSGHLYCQQNGRTVVCAHVAIRTLLAALLPEKDVSYREISNAAGYDLQTCGSMHTSQIVQAFENFGFSVHQWAQPPNLKESIPIYRSLYLGIESGGGGLLGFEVQGITSGQRPFREGVKNEGEDDGRSGESRHIIPLFGHTFNKHIWVNESVGCYSLPGSVGARSFVSDNWISTFIGHDDNVGPNIYIPRFYAERCALSAIAVVPRQGALKSAGNSICYIQGSRVEQLAVDWLLSAVRGLLNEWRGEFANPKKDFNEWLERLRLAIEATASEGHVAIQTFAHVVLRSLLVPKDQYLAQLEVDRVTNQPQESAQSLQRVSDALPDYIWLVEFSLPHLYPVNERKLGEIVFSARQMHSGIRKDTLLIRLPTRYVKPQFNEQNDRFSFDEFPSNMLSHTPCFVFPEVRRVG